MNMYFVLLDGVREYEDVIQVNPDEISYVFSVDPRHQPLKGCQCIAVSLLHCVGHECPEDRRECGLLYIRQLNTDLLIGISHIDLGSIFHSGDLHTDLILIREWGYILKGVVVLLPSVDNCAELAVLLCYAKKWCGLFHRFHFSPTSQYVLVGLFPKLTQ